MLSAAAIAIWVLLGLTIAAIIVSLIFLRRQFSASAEPFSGLLPLHVKIAGSHRRQVFLSLASRSMVGIISWPASVLLGIFLMFKSGVNFKNLDDPKYSREGIARIILARSARYCLQH